MGVRRGNAGAQLEGKLGEPLPTPAFGLSVHPARAQATGQVARKLRPPEVSPPESAPPDERPTPGCKQRAEMGRVKQPHALMSPRGLDPGQNPSQTPAQPWGHPPWGLIGTLLPGSPQNHWGPWAGGPHSAHSVLRPQVPWSRLSPHPMSGLHPCCSVTHRAWAPSAPRFGGESAGD